MEKNRHRLGKDAMNELRAREIREKWTEAERERLLLTYQQDEACRQAVAAGQEPLFEILLTRPDLLLKYGV